VGGSVEKVGRLEVGVPLGIIGVDGINVSREQDVGSPGKIFSFRFHFEAEAGKIPGYRSNHQVFYFELNFAVGRVDRPLAGSHFFRSNHFDWV
jgi:hypothetical protein